MLRLLANLAEYRETASILTQPNLLDRVAIMISSENSAVSDAAIRTVRLLSKHKSYIRVSFFQSTLFRYNTIATNESMYIAVESKSGKRTSEIKV